MMLFENTENLTIDEIAMLVIQKGSFVSSSEYHNLCISLYRIDNEFVEIWHNTLEDNVNKVEVLKNKMINPFLKYLKICCNN